jgi:phage terminase large subunit-like protein
LSRKPAQRRAPEPARSHYVTTALDYTHRVQSGEQPASRHVRIACEAFLQDYARAIAGDGPWGFRADLAHDAMAFAEALPNIKGPAAGQPIRLMPWQTMLFAALFGFVERGTDTRRYRQAVVFVPKGNGKTTVAAPLALYLTFADGEGGAEGYAAATTRDQARILFDATQNMLRQAPRVARELGVSVAANAISAAKTASRFMPISSDAKTLDGLNVAIAVCDEIASHKTAEVYDALRTAMGKRRHPLLLSISTATGNTSGIGKQLWDYSVRVLEGAQEDDRLLGLLYTIDEGDDPWAEETWIKANPGWGVSVVPDAIRGIMRQARNNPAQEAAARTRHLNIWLGADEALFSMRSWSACTNRDLELSQMEGRDCHIALDLASKTDLAALAIVFPRDLIEDDDRKLHYTVFSRCYLNEAAVLEARNPSYPGWAANNELVITPGNETDFGAIEDDILDLCRRFRVLSLAYDPWNATQLAQRLTSQGVPCVEFRMNTQNLSEATKEADAAMRAGRLRHDGNGPLAWCISNCVGHYDARQNVFPRRQREDQKIDAAISLIMAIARAMTNKTEVSIYETRGLLVLG